MTHTLSRIYRPVTSESLEKIPSIETMAEVFPSTLFRGVRKNPGTSILLHGQIPKTHRWNIAGSELSTRKIVYPIPETGSDVLSLPVKEVRFLGKDMWKRALAIILEDSENILENEMNVYLKRLGVPPRQMLPHVTLAYVDTSHATTRLSGWMEEKLPDTIELGTQMTSPALEVRSSMYPEPPKVQPTGIQEVRTLRPIPAGFISSLGQK